MSTVEPLVSIIIPTYNRSRLLIQTVDSALAQSYSPLEVIVVDDGSTDGTPGMLAQRYGERIRVVEKANSGVERSRMHGLQAARGELITFLDDDDLIGADKIARQVAVLAARSELGVVHCGFDFVDVDGRFLEFSGRLPEGDVRIPLLWGCFPWSGGPLMRRECLGTIGYDEHRDWFGDWGMWLRSAFAGYRWGCVQESLGSYRMLAGSMTDTGVANVERLIFHILDTAFARFKVPAAAVADRARIYAGWRLFVALRYYAGGFIDAAARNLTEALVLRPDWQIAPEEPINAIVADALSPRMRIRDPLAFLNGIFAQLPAKAQGWTAWRERALADAQFGLALRDFAGGRAADGSRRAEDALALNPALGDSPERIAERVFGYAQSLPVAMRLSYALTAFGNMPSSIRQLSKAQSQILVDLNLSSAFGDWADGRRATIPPKLVAAIRARPSLLRHRGIVSILARSLPAYVAGSQSRKAG